MSELVKYLSADLAPVSRWYVPRRLLLGIGAGLAVSVLLVMTLLGPRPDLPGALQTRMFWMKLAYPLCLALIAGLAAERLGRPAGSARTRIIWLVVPFILVIAIAALQFGFASPSARENLVMGGSARVCSLFVLAFATPPLVGLIWAMRGLAPTRLAQAGAAIGLWAGAAGAFAYAWHCTETGAPFLAIWYTLGILTTMIIGWATGPLLLRWK